MTPKVAVIYLSYNSLPYLEEVVSSWGKIEYPRDAFEIVVVENASTDGSAEWFKTHVLPHSGKTLPTITFLSQSFNRGFAGGNNAGMEYALRSGMEYVYLHNNDLKMAPTALTEVVKVAESDRTIGSVQSLMLLWQDPARVNSTGGMVHFLGFGFVRDNGRLFSECNVKNGEEIFYGSGAATLYRASCLMEVGLLDPFLWLYHEDLELGWRLRLAGFRNVLSTTSLAYHFYEFRRSSSKIFWMERNRFLVHVSHLRLGSLLLILPLMLVLEPFMYLFALKGGWVKEKARASFAFLKPSTWKYLFGKRRESRMLRQVSDRAVMRLWTGKISHQETSGPIVDNIGNPVLAVVWGVLRRVIVW